MGSLRTAAAAAPSLSPQDGVRDGERPASVGRDVGEPLSNFTADPARLMNRYWGLFGLVVLVLVGLAAVAYMVGSTSPVGWDEADYVNRAFSDEAALRIGPRPFVGQLVREDVARPPAYRLLHVPLTLAVGISVPS